MDTNGISAGRKKRRPNPYLQGLASIFDFSGSLAIRELRASVQSAEQGYREDGENMAMYFRRALAEFAATHPLKAEKNAERNEPGAAGHTEAERRAG